VSLGHQQQVELAEALKDYNDEVGPITKDPDMMAAIYSYKALHCVNSVDPATMMANFNQYQAFGEELLEQVASVEGLKEYDDEESKKVLEKDRLGEVIVPGKGDCLPITLCIVLLEDHNIDKNPLELREELVDNAKQCGYITPEEAATMRRPGVLLDDRIVTACANKYDICFRIVKMRPQKDEPRTCLIGRRDDCKVSTIIHRPKHFNATRRKVLILNNRGRKALARAVRIKPLDVKGMVIAWKGNALQNALKPVASAAVGPAASTAPPVVGSKTGALTRAVRIKPLDVKGMVIAWKGNALQNALKPVASAASTAPPVVGSKIGAPHSAPFPGGTDASPDPSVAPPEVVPENQGYRKQGGREYHRKKRRESHPVPKANPKLRLEWRLLLARTARLKYAAVAAVTKQADFRRFVYSFSMLMSGKLYGRRWLCAKEWLYQYVRNSEQNCDGDCWGAASDTAFGGGLRTSVLQIGWQAKSSYVHKWKVQARVFGRVAVNARRQQLKWKAQARETVCALLGSWSSKVYWLKLTKFRLNLCFKRLQRQRGTKRFTQMVQQHKVMQLLRNRARFNRFIQELLFDPSWGAAKWKADNRWMQREAAAVKVQVAVRGFIAKRVSNRLQRETVNNAAVQQPSLPTCAVLTLSPMPCGAHAANALLGQNMITNSVLYNRHMQLHKSEQLYHQRGASISVLVSVLAEFGMRVRHSGCFMQEFDSTDTDLLINFNEVHWLTMRRAEQSWKMFDEGNVIDLTDQYAGLLVQAFAISNTCHVIPLQRGVGVPFEMQEQYTGIIIFGKGHEVNIQD